MEPILPAGQCTADGSVIGRVSGYDIQQPSSRWSLDAITTSIRRFLTSAGLGFSGNPERTDVVFVAPDNQSALVMSTFAANGTRVFCGLSPTIAPAPEEDIIVRAPRPYDDGLTVAEREVRRQAFGDMGPNPNRPMDFGLPGIGRCAGGSFEDNGITLRILSDDGTGRMECSNVPQGGFEFNPGNYIERERENNEREIEARGGRVAPRN